MTTDVLSAEFELIKAYNESIDAHFEKEYEELNGDGYWEFKERIQKAKERRRKIRSLKRVGASIATSVLVVLIMALATLLSKLNYSRSDLCLNM